LVHVRFQVFFAMSSTQFIQSVQSAQSIKNLASLKRDRSERPVVLHLTPDLETGWNAREVVDLGIQSHRSGFRPLIASAGGALVLEAERTAVRHTQMPLNRRGLFSRWRCRSRLDSLIQRERPAVVHAHGIDMIAPLLRAARARPFAALVDLTQPVSVTPAHQKILQAAAQRGFAFRVPTAYMVRHLRQDFQLATDRLFCIPPGIDLSWYDPPRVTPERLQTLGHLWRLPEQGTVVLMGVPFAPGAGHTELLDALQKLKRPDLYTVMVGDDRAAPGWRAEIEKQILAKGLAGQVIMPESCADWPAACWLASFVVAPNTIPRGQANELLAAQAMGRPVIVTDTGANIELVKPGETAWVLATGDVPALASALDEASQLGGDRRIDLAVATRAFIDETFPLARWAQALFELYRQLSRVC
jgi:glycosyltransferase involved in cell wall biosynthesis